MKKTPRIKSLQLLQTATLFFPPWNQKESTKRKNLNALTRRLRNFWNSILMMFEKWHNLVNNVNFKKIPILILFYEWLGVDLSIPEISIDEWTYDNLKRYPKKLLQYWANKNKLFQANQKPNKESLINALFVLGWWKLIDWTEENNEQSYGFWSPAWGQIPMGRKVFRILGMVRSDQ